MGGYGASRHLFVDLEPYLGFRVPYVNGPKSPINTRRRKTAQEPYIVWSLGPKASKYESLEPKGYEYGALGLQGL